MRVAGDRLPVIDGHPNAVLPLKAALAATVAWVLLTPVGGFVDHYQYYAPLGAVITVTPAVARGARSAVHTILAIIVGGLLAIGVDALPLPQPVAIAAAVAGGVAFSYSRHFGSMGSWVPFVALFALILHDHHTWTYVISYALLAGVGGLIGLLVAYLLPQIPTGPVTRAGRRLSEGLADALAALGEAVHTSAPLGDERREGLRASLGDRSQELRDAVRGVQDATRANWRVSTATASRHPVEDRARSLQRLADRVVYVLEMEDTVVGATTAGPGDTGLLPPSLRRTLAHALCRAADSLRDESPGTASAWTVQDRRVLRRLRETLDESAHLEDEARLALIGITATLQDLAEQAEG